MVNRVMKIGQVGPLGRVGLALVVLAWLACVAHAADAPRVIVARVFDTLPQPEFFRDGDTFIRCVFDVPDAHTELKTEAKGLIFQQCIVRNIHLPADVKVEGTKPICEEWIEILQRPLADVQRDNDQIVATMQAAQKSVELQAPTAKGTIAEALADVEQRKQVAVTVAVTALLDEKIRSEGTPDTRGMKSRRIGNIVSYGDWKPAKEVVK
jgi:hypothetical protein